MQVINTHTTLGVQVLKTMLYFDIFNYPLKVHEIIKFLPVDTTPEEIGHCIKALVTEKFIFQFGEFYSLHENDANIVRRVKGNTEANKFLKIAKNRAQFIARFPFVRAVMASGSLSKGYMDEKSDLDFFIVTEPNRLWIARTLLVMYKRLFLFNSHKEFCVNYFVDRSHLEIEEKNLFTAIELATLIPLHNLCGYTELQNANPWIKQFFPNFKPRNTGEGQAPEVTFPARIFEPMLSRFCQRLDSFFMRMTSKRWQKMYGSDYGKKDFDIAFKTKKHVSKNHPKNYQKRILDLYEMKLDEYKSRFGLLSKT